MAWRDHQNPGSLSPRGHRARHTPEVRDAGGRADAGPRVEHHVGGPPHQLRQLPHLPLQLLRGVEDLSRERRAVQRSPRGAGPGYRMTSPRLPRGGEGAVKGSLASGSSPAQSPPWLPPPWEAAPSPPPGFPAGDASPWKEGPWVLLLSLPPTPRYHLGHRRRPMPPLEHHPQQQSIGQGPEAPAAVQPLSDQPRRCRRGPSPRFTGEETQEGVTQSPVPRVCRGQLLPAPPSSGCRDRSATCHLVPSQLKTLPTAPGSGANVPARHEGWSGLCVMPATRLGPAVPFAGITAPSSPIIRADFPGPGSPSQPLLPGKSLPLSSRGAS